VKKYLSAKKIGLLILFSGMCAGAWIYARKWVTQSAAVRDKIVAATETIEWQEDAWKAYLQLAKQYQQPFWITGSLSVTDSAAGILNQSPVNFKWGMQKNTFYYQLDQWEVVQKDTLLLLVDNTEKNMIVQTLPADKKYRSSLPGLPNLLSMPASMVKGVMGKEEPNQQKSITLYLRDAEIEKIQLFYNVANGYLTQAIIWQISFGGLVDQPLPADSLEAKGVEEVELEWEGGDSSKDNSSLQAWLGKKITRITYNPPLPIEKGFSPMDKFVFIRDGKLLPAAAFENYQFAIK